MLHSVQIPLFVLDSPSLIIYDVRRSVNTTYFSIRIPSLTINGVVCIVRSIRRPTHAADNSVTIPDFFLRVPIFKPGYNGWPLFTLQYSLAQPRRFSHDMSLCSIIFSQLEVCYACGSVKTMYFSGIVPYLFC